MYPFEKFPDGDPSKSLDILLYRGKGRTHDQTVGKVSEPDDGQLIRNPYSKFEGDIENRQGVVIVEREYGIGPFVLNHAADMLLKKIVFPAVRLIQDQRLFQGNTMMGQRPAKSFEPALRRLTAVTADPGNAPASRPSQNHRLSRWLAPAL